MTSDTSNKLLILLVLIFLILMLGPYLGFHPMGAPEITNERTNNKTSVENEVDLLQEADMPLEVPDMVEPPEDVETYEEEPPKKRVDGFEER